ncbi:MAG: DUF4445 domain-containing protein [Clostridia bacterium]|nr:DUF4445 domain-containing protein [Clostridia bacterium]
MLRLKVSYKGEMINGSFPCGTVLSDALGQLGITQNNPCGGNGRCKKCGVLVNGQKVLACQFKLQEDTVAQIINNAIDIVGLTYALLPEIEADPLVAEGYGMAVDIGTTTIAGYIFEFPQCRCIKVSAAANRQAKYGADVISRIGYADKGGLAELGDILSAQIKELSAGYDISKYVITGNTTMLHFLTGKDPAGIAAAPFVPESLFGQWYGNMYLPKCISAYIGADITTAILASGMMKDKTALLIDIGTNGEMVLRHNGRLMCCSTAAGPAFEGALISQGVSAVPGAIDHVYIVNGSIGYTTINGAAPNGICGTGIIDAVACLLSLGILDKDGYLEHDFEIGESGVFLTHNDIRQIQLAKSAVLSGIETLLEGCGIDYSGIDRFYISGGFGSYINKANAAYIGLIPAELVNKALVIGNGAGAGAEMILINKGCIENVENICSHAETIELSANEYFTKRYIENMIFKNTVYDEE